MNEIIRKSTVSTVILTIMLILYFSAVCLINFSAVPAFYDGDMYCDYRYAMEAWEHRSIFPEGWVFGNQLNAVSTPVLAAVMYGVSNNMNYSMAAACVIMAVLVVACYDWMLQPALKGKESRLVAIVVFMTATLYCGRAVRGNQGWTLLFTMCSYYAGYSITAFLAFGCYLRSLQGHREPRLPMLVLTCILSFGTGIQSIRQTAIMVAPILAVEFFRLVFRFQEWKTKRNPLWVGIGITISNIMGLCYVRMRGVNQNQIFGSIELTPVLEWKQAVVECIAMIKDLLGADHPEALFLLACVCGLCAWAFFWLLKRNRTWEDLALLLMIGMSVAVIAVIDIFTSMFIRPRYYFMIYPLIGFLIAYLYNLYGNRIKRYLLVFVIVFFCLAWNGELSPVCKTAVHPEEEIYEISDFLLENGYTTIYAAWDQGNDIAVASNGKLTVGYWQKEIIFEKVPYLCNPDVYNADPEVCIYVFRGREAMEQGMDAAESMGAQLSYLCHYLGGDIYLCTAQVNLMK